MELEKISDNYRGLNLTPYTLWGILNHTKTEYDSCDNKFEEKDVCGLRRSLKKCNGFDKMFSLEFYNKYKEDIKDQEHWTVEALVVRQADEIAQWHHDIEDGLEANIIDKDELIEVIHDNFRYWVKEDYWYNELERLDRLIFYPSIDSLLVI